MDVIRFIFSNRILDMALLAWAVSQAIKVLLTLITERRFVTERMFGSGGMPSAHSAAVCAAAVACFRLYGMESPAFGLALLLALIVMYDATHVRQAASQHAKILNFMMQNWREMDKNGLPEFFGKQLKELLGHSTMQVLCGAVIGIIFGMLA